MSETVKAEKTVKTGKAPKKSWFKGFKSEFKKIVWPDKKSLVKQTTAVVSISIILGLIITFLDYVLKFGVDFLVK
ncbi:MAG TPA: preprotein translocase subunit SecE [Candidatus Merdenecus merdavium]|nr:preprotein translocase subunit SecE [Candidatus Merdenecus merdavium]